jgi:tripartite-type tricarboxylate transporter receptor subunit TctC
MLDTVTPTLPHVRGGRMKMLATCGAERARQVPEIPTVAETILPGFTSTVWGVLMAPAGTPAETIQRINADTTALLHRADIAARHEQLGTTIWTATPQATTEFIAAEMSKWDETARAIGIERGAVPG